MCGYRTVEAAICILFCVVNVFGETVLFTNSQSQLERSYNVNLGDGVKAYQLDVPGSSPITIIEADANKENIERTAKSISTNSNSEYNERKSKDYIVPGSSHEKEEGAVRTRKEGERCYGPSCHDDQFDKDKRTVYSPELLNKFLKEYAEKIKNADEKTKKILQQMQLTTPFEDDTFNEKGYSKNKISDRIDLAGHKDGKKKYNGWDDIDSKKNQHPYNDRDGWVTLEAIPWTRSKISKWQANSQKPNKPSNNFNTYDSERDPSTLIDRFQSGYNKPDPESDFDDNPFNTFPQIPKPNNNNYNNKYNNKYKPNYGDIETDDFTNESPRPSWAKPSQNRPTQHGQNSNRKPQKPPCDHDHEEENDEYDGYNRRVSNHYHAQDVIITDGRPGDFPPNESGYSQKRYQRKPSQDYTSTYNTDHPSSYPMNGDGQWVLLSTTKGYKFPKNRQRSMSLSPNPLVSHRSVRLIVLPAVNGSKENMTLSHGGLLEVEPSFQTVDESRIQYEKSKAINKTVTSRPVRSKGIVATDPTPDGSAVMAAVGAGLVPATMAMIMPMVLGRKKRNIFRPIPLSHNVTQNPNFIFESTLERTK